MAYTTSTTNNNKKQQFTVIDAKAGRVLRVAADNYRQLETALIELGYDMNKTGIEVDHADAEALQRRFG